jgi:hypothetical protein
MNAKKVAAALGLGALALAGCAVVPEGPSVRVLPAPGKPFEVFAAEDQYCRGYAQQAAGGNAQEAANTSAVGSAVAGTAIGAAAGALIGGNSRSAGTGAGVGLLMGSAVGANESARSGYGIQRRYDIAYEQCMYAKGNLLPGQSIPYNSRLPPPPPPAQTLPPPPPPPPPPPAR